MQSVKPAVFAARKYCFHYCMSKSNTPSANKHLLLAVSSMWEFHPDW